MELKKKIERVWMWIPNLEKPGTNSTNSTHGQEVTEEYANAVSSLVCPGIHAPVLDIDFAAQLIESSTPGHYHLYLDKAMSWKKYKRVLRALAKAGVIEKGYAKASIRLGYSAVRKPGQKKPRPLEPSPF